MTLGAYGEDGAEERLTIGDQVVMGVMVEETGLMTGVRGIEQIREGSSQEGIRLGRAQAGQISGTFELRPQW